MIDRRTDLHQWVREELRLSRPKEQALLESIDHIITQREHLWQQSKQEALQALAGGFSERLRKLREELEAKDATVHSVAGYFEEIVAELTKRTHLDPTTHLLNSRRFTEELEAFLNFEQRGHWCAVGFVDIRAFKSYNDAFGHALGDRIIDRVAKLLREQARSGDLIGKDALTIDAGHDRHARFGGDEFCFLIPHLDQVVIAMRIAKRFRESVERYDWSSEDPRLAARPVKVDVGVVCLDLGDVHERRRAGRRLARDLVAKADEQMYKLKGGHVSDVVPLRLRIEHGQLVEYATDCEQGLDGHEQRADPGSDSTNA